ncbi:uroporphyrinogen-III synthase [Acinetobacter sp. ANC 3832]|uniref:uroporphyrinogen-III synthase n=1 Tax=Acinetobacter sp. ANC 3832 TaxID=1977874 RepID=UPI000A341A07|nr:uroporphyrinogen-III synthase [Acinetobacter sp. ANC 3832]OTG91676.1 uroporphyrinogen-III synthase [Acinetobacter sp. ANC 3832]
MLFINTRPVERAQALTQCLAQTHFQVLDLPLLELQALPYTAYLHQLYAQLSDTQIIVVVSPIAVDVGMQYLQESGLLLSQLSHIKWITVGQTTAKRLAEYGIESIVPEVETSEGMLSLPIFKNIPNLKKIAFWRGEGGRQFMMQQCLDQNIEILNFLLYERHLPASTIKKFTQFEQTLAKYEQPYWVCISSEASWHHWIQLTQKNQTILQNCHYLVLGERLYQILQHHSKQHQHCFKIHHIVNLDPNTVLQAMTELERKL